MFCDLPNTRQCPRGRPQFISRPGWCHLCVCRCKWFWYSGMLVRGMPAQRDTTYNSSWLARIRNVSPVSEFPTTVKKNMADAKRRNVGQEFALLQAYIAYITLVWLCCRVQTIKKFRHLEHPGMIGILRWRNAPGSCMNVGMDRSRSISCKIWGLHGGDYEECRLLEYINSVLTSQETHYVSATNCSQLMPCKFWGFDGGDYGERRLLGYRNPIRTSQETHYVSATQSSWLMLCKIWGLHGGDYEECRLLEYRNSVPTSQETHYVSATNSSQLMPCKIWGFYGGDYEERRLLGYRNPIRTSQETHYVSATQSSWLMLWKIWGFHGNDCEECLLECYSVWTSLEQRFRRNVPLQSSRPKVPAR
jgi:hypothetical protein